MTMTAHSAKVNGLPAGKADNKRPMTQENEALLEKLERTPDMDLRDQRIILQTLYRNEYYFDVETWRRYCAMAERFRGKLHDIFPAMGS